MPPLVTMPPVAGSGSLLPPNPGDDFNDLLRREGLEAVRAVIAGAREWLPGAARVEETPQPLPPGAKPARFTIPKGALPAIRADDGNLARVAGHAWEAIRATNTPPWLFLFAGSPAWIESDDKGTPLPTPMTENRLRFALARLATWLKQAPSSQLTPAHPPLAAIKDILATPDPELPVLAGVVTVPVFGPDGSLQTVPGYYPASRLLFELPAGLVLPAIPWRPSAADIAAARSLLVDELLGDFPFVGEAERAHTAVGTVAAREREIVAALSSLDTLWAELFPAKQQRLLHLLIETITVTPTGFDIILRAAGLRSLALELRGGDAPVEHPLGAAA